MITSSATSSMNVRIFSDGLLVCVDVETFNWILCPSDGPRVKLRTFIPLESEEMVWGPRFMVFPDKYKFLNLLEDDPRSYTPFDEGIRSACTRRSPFSSVILVSSSLRKLLSMASDSVLS